MTYEGMRLKFRNNIYIPLTCKQRGKKLRNSHFTIISNNCWSGTVYEAYNLQKQTPTVGLFFMASDYIRFLSDLQHYLSVELEFIKPEHSKWKNQLKSNSNWGTYPIALLDDIEVQLLHYYGSEEDIRSKWKRRIDRIDWDHLLVKFNDQNSCTQEDIEAFFNLPFKNKLFFTCKDNTKNRDKYGRNYIVIKQRVRNETVMASYEPYCDSKYLILTELINSLGE